MAIKDADVVILGTRNASQYPYQREFGLRLADITNKLIVIATCDPYDFLDEVDKIKNYITVYEPTIPAFKAAVDIMFGASHAAGKYLSCTKSMLLNILFFSDLF
jgi:beta-N-acetylhexosaminidase